MSNALPSEGCRDVEHDHPRWWCSFRRESNVTPGYVGFCKCQIDDVHVVERKQVQQGTASRASAASKHHATTRRSEHLQSGKTCESLGRSLAVHEVAASTQPKAIAHCHFSVIGRRLDTASQQRTTRSALANANSNSTPHDPAVAEPRLSAS
jgi:hypothetical protein